MIERKRTFVPGLDKLIEGGIPENTTLLLSGRPGTGKTVFGLQFSYKAAKNGEKAVYANFEERREEVFMQAGSFGWDMEEVEDNGRLRVLTPDPRNLEKVLSDIEEKVDEIGADRLVIDSISDMPCKTSPEHLPNIFNPSEMKRMPISGEYITRRIVQYILKRVKEMGITTLITSELGHEKNEISRDGISEYICGGIIKLNAQSLGSELGRSLEILKLRSTDIRGGINSFRFTEEGIELED